MSVGDRKLDVFSSMFRSAVREVFTLDPPEVGSVLLVSDLDSAGTEAMATHARRLLSTIDHAEDTRWKLLSHTDWAGGENAPIPSLLDRIDAEKPDLVITWRQLLGRVRDLPWSVGSVVDTLTQARDIPVLLIPSPDDTEALAAMVGTHRVLVVTDHLTGDDRLVNWGVQICSRSGTLYLAHVEDDETLARYLDVIGQLPDLDSDIARQQISKKLLELPQHYLASVIDVLQRAGIEETVVPEVHLGHALRDYQALIDEHEVDLLVLNSKDEDQAAMHGMAHALAVELRHKPLLML